VWALHRNEHIVMPVLRFVCPATGHQVETDIDLDAQGFADLPRDATALACPHCDQPHILAGVQAWLGDIEPEHE
jgi:hypothetical protein